MKNFLLASLAAVLAVAAPTIGQTLNRPVVHVWQAGPGPTAASGAFPGIVRFTRAQIDQGANPPLNAEAAADAVVEQIHVRRNLPAAHPDHLGEGQPVSLSFDGGFARYQPDIDEGGAYFASALRFFQEEDRLKTNERQSGADGEAFGFESNSARTYRHPFLRNALPNVPGNSEQPAKLRTWFVQFVQRYEWLRANSTVYADVPAPSYFYLDMEVIKGGAGGGADLTATASETRHMLWVLAHDHVFNSPSELIWNTRALPPYFGTNVTLANLYDAECRPLLPGNPDILAKLNDGQRPDSDDNRPIMLWWDTVLRRAEDAVYKNCFFDVVAQTWPACKTSNYNGMRLDGVAPVANGQSVPNTGWYLGSDDTRKIINGVEAYPARLPMRSLVRGKIEPWFLSGPQFWREATGVWDVSKQYTSGTMMAPELYLLGEFQQWHAENISPWNGAGFGLMPDGSPVPCHQQPNLYVGDSMLPDYFHPPAVTPRLVLETLQESSMRRFRAIVEACIDSFGGHHEEELVPWVSMNDGGGVAAHPFFLRRLLAMLRAHNVPEVVLFSGLNMDTDFEGGVALWKAARDVIDQAYASHVEHYFDLAAGAFPDEDPSKLEFVLKDAAGNPRTVDITSRANIGSQGQLPTISSLTLVVRIGGLANYRTQPAQAQATGGHGYMVVVEGTVTPADGACPRKISPMLTTKVSAQNWNEPFRSDAIRQVDPVEDDAPQSLPPRYSDSSGMIARAPNGNYDEVPFRVVCDLRADASGPDGPEYVDADGNLVLWVRQVEPLDGASWGEGGPDCHLPWSFTSHIDLVQVIPFPFDAPPPAPYSGPRRPQPVDVADPDYSAWYYSNPTIRGQSGAGGFWEPASLDDAGSIPMHYDDWNYAHEGLGGHWPDACINNQHPANSYLLSSAFGLAPANPDKQTATVKFTLPVWTDAPLGAAPTFQPYRVWYWLPDIVQWVDFTSQMVVTIGRGSQGAMAEVTVASTGAHALPPGYYALTLNVLPPTSSDQPYAVYCGGTTGYAQLAAQPNSFLYGANDEMIPAIQYNFRLYPDCDAPYGCIDPLPEHRCPGTGACPADLDDGSGNGYPDGGVDINDLVFFMPKYEDGNILVDLDDGTGTGSQDGGVDINDLLFFLTHYEGGC